MLVPLGLTRSNEAATRETCRGHNEPRRRARALHTPRYSSSLQTQGPTRNENNFVRRAGTRPPHTTCSRAPRASTFDDLGRLEPVGRFASSSGPPPGRGRAPPRYADPYREALVEFELGVTLNHVDVGELRPHSPTRVLARRIQAGTLLPSWPKPPPAAGRSASRWLSAISAHASPPVVAEVPIIRNAPGASRDPCDTGESGADARSPFPPDGVA
jgi:hypothetical protein